MEELEELADPDITNEDDLFVWDENYSLWLTGARES